MIETGQSEREERVEALLALACIINGTPMMQLEPVHIWRLAEMIGEDE